MSSLKSKVLLALRWSAGARFSAQVITWLATIYVIRLLEPADYGLMAMSEFLFALLLLLSSRGLGTALIQAKEVSDVQIRQLFGAVILVNSVLFFLQWFGAPLLAAYYGEPRVTALTRVLALGFVFVSLETIPSALLMRDIEFKLKSLVQFSAAVISVTTVVSLAIAGFGVWSLVTGRLVQLGVQAIGLNLVKPTLLRPLFSFSASRNLIAFGGLYTATSVLWFIYGRADVFIAGRFLDANVVGIYSVSLHLATLVVVKAMPLLNQIALPAYSRIQDDPKLVGQYFVKVVRIMTLVAFPAFLGLAAVAPEFVRTVLGAKYEAAILPLVLLCLVMPMTLVSSLYPAAILGVGRPRIEFGNKLFGTIVMPIAFLIGSRHGATGLAVSWLTAYPLVVLFQANRARDVIHVGFGDLARATCPPLVASLVMAGIVLLAKKLLGGSLTPVLELTVLVGTGVLVYVLQVALTMNGRLREARQILARQC